MALATAFRLSFFVTLALACACLALAEMFFLWWMGLFLVGTLLLLGLAYRWEERWVLSADAANRFGMVIAIGTAFWILYNLPRSDEDLLAAGVPWPAGLLPHLGPLLILLLLVKLFRPKRLADYWVIQTIGLMMVTLACVLAAEPLFGVLLIFYLAGLLWSLALFYQVREEAFSRHGEPGKLPLFAAVGEAPKRPLPWRHLGLGRVCRWTGMVVVSGLALFLIAPRQDNLQWEPKQLASAAKGSMKTGFESGMDLNRVGKVEMSEDPAFEAQAMDVRGPKLDLDPETRWFMQTLDYYSQGRWSPWGQGTAPPTLTWGITARPQPLASPNVEGWSHPRTPPADLKDPDFYLYFKVRPFAAGGLVLAEPITGTRLGLYPWRGENPDEASFFYHLEGTDSIMSGQVALGRRRIYQYGQVLRKLDDPNRVLAKQVNPMYRQFLINQDVPEPIVGWVHELLGKLPDLTEDDRRLDSKGRVPVDAHAKVAQALMRYLAFSGDFGYSLDLRRHQFNMDPLADFLLNVKEGHCERYAGGLTLMLRAVGIPARVVRGYRGLDHLGNGVYLVRQNQAHSWVQALVDDANDEDVKWWLTLDPTPSSERINKPLLSWLGWLLQHLTENETLWRHYIMEYNADQQGRTWELIRKKLTPDDPWAVVKSLLAVGTFLAGGFFSLRYWRCWSRPSLSGKPAVALDPAASGPGFYRRFLEVVQRRLNEKPQPGQTPREFGLLTRDRLQSQARDETCTAIPMKLVGLLYRIRFGGGSLTDAEEQQALRDVETLENLLCT
jgi:hypothetical protein